MMSGVFLGITPATVTNKPGHRGEPEVSRKTIRAGKTGVTRLSLRSYSRAIYCTGPMGAIGTRFSLRPLHDKEGERYAKLGRIAPRERGCVSFAV